MRVCVTGATGFVGAHVARAFLEAGHEVRVTYRNPDRLTALGDLEVEPVKADVLDRSALRRALREVELLVHAAGYVGARPRRLVWEINALSPRVAVEAAAAAGVRRVLLTSSVAAVGPAPPDELADESTPYTAGGLGITYADAKHEGELEALATGVRKGVELVVVNPAYLLGAPLDRSQPGETSTRAVGNYLRGRLPAVVDGAISVVDVEDVAAGHVAAAERGRPGERYILGGHNVAWTDLIDRVAELSGVHHPLVVIPPEMARLARLREQLGLPGMVTAEAYTLMGQRWVYSSRKAKRELGYRFRSLNRVLRETIDWYAGLMRDGRVDGGLSTLSLASTALRAGGRFGLASALRAAERYAGRRLITGA